MPNALSGRMHEAFIAPLPRGMALSWAMTGCRYAVLMLFQLRTNIFNVTFVHVARIAFGRGTAGSAICARRSAPFAASG